MEAVQLFTFFFASPIGGKGSNLFFARFKISTICQLHLSEDHRPTMTAGFQCSSAYLLVCLISAKDARRWKR